MTTEFTLTYRDIVKITKKTAHSIGTDKGHPRLAGIHFHKTDSGQYFAVTTNGCVLTQVAFKPVEVEGEFKAFTISKSAIAQIKQIKVEKRDRCLATISVQIDHDLKTYKISSKDCSFGGELVDYEFPDYQRVIPENWQGFTNGDWKDWKLSSELLVGIFDAASYDATDFRTSAVPTRIHYDFANHSCVVITESDPAVLYVVMTMR